MENINSETIEFDLLLEAIFLKYGYDFRSYSKASMRRKIEDFLLRFDIKKISDLQHEVLYDQDVFEKLLGNLSVNVTTMFRNPDFYKAVKAHVVPELKKKSVLKIWHAGCATGQEVYSLAILLTEEGLYEKCRIYATDMDELVIKKAKEAIYPIDKIQEYTLNYNKFGGKGSLSDYYTAKYDYVMLDPELRNNILFSIHNLAGDSVFGEFDLIICRNVLIYFNSELQNRVFKLFKESMIGQGFLCLGSKETVRVSKYARFFNTVSMSQKIYRLIK